VWSYWLRVDPPEAHSQGIPQLGPPGMDYSERTCSTSRLLDYPLNRIYDRSGKFSTLLLSLVGRYSGNGRGRTLCSSSSMVLLCS
jgi:hypothetical protein